jgi:predicted Zn-dependent peptidase
MKNRKVFQKAVFIVLIVLILLSLVAPAIFSQPAAAPAPAQEKLLNGLKVLMWPDAKADNVSIRVRVHAGAAFDPQGKEGLMRILAANLFPNEGSREYFSEDLGGSLDVVTTYDYIQINASAKPEHFLQMMETVAAAVSNLGIDKETTAKLRTEQLARIAAAEKDPIYLSETVAAAKIFGTAPYGRPLMGTAASVQKIDFADLVDAKSRFLTADNATVAITGNFGKELAFRAARRYFGSWLKSDKRVPSSFRQPDDFAAGTVKVEFADAAKPIVRTARRAAGRADANYYATRIFNAVRMAQQCSNDSLYKRNLLSGVYWTAEEQDSTAACALAGGAAISEDQFNSAKAAVIAELNARVATPSGLADIWLDTDTYRSGSPQEELRKVSAVTYADVKAVADAIAKAPAARISVQAPAEKK